MHRARMIASTVLDDYEEGRLMRCGSYTQMINSMKMEARSYSRFPLNGGFRAQIPADIIQEEIQMVPSPVLSWTMWYPTM